MKKWIINAAIMAVIAELVVLGQWLVVRASDAFTLVQHDGQTYKVFSYGFPFAVADCNSAIGLATPEDQIPWRVIGNWAVFFLFGLLVMKAIKMFRTRVPTVRV